MSDLSHTIKFASDLYRTRARTAIAAYVQREPMARLRLRPGRENPYAVYDRIRSGGTMVPTPLGNWASTSHRVCGSVLRDKRFGVRPQEDANVMDDFDLSFLERNPPDHTRLRRLAQPAFSPRGIESYRDRIEGVVGELLDEADRQGRFDLVSGLAAPLPIAVITQLLGIPDARSAEFAQYGAVIGSALDGIKSLRHAQQLQRNDAKLTALFEDLFTLRRREPRDDVISRLLAADGDQIKPSELRPMCGLLLIAGFETTVNLIGNAVLALLDNPEQWAALCADPQGLAPRAVEEALRFDPPVQSTMRVALEPLELDGRKVHKGQWVVILIGAANRDPEAYDHPDVFDLHRDPGPEHLAFSAGIHYCIGQALARLEGAVALQMLAERMPNLRRAGALKRRNATTIRGPQRFMVAAR